MRQQNLTFNVSSIRRHTKQSSKKSSRRRRSGSNGSQKGEVVSRRKKLKCALITKCSGVQGVVSGSASAQLNSPHSLSISRCRTRSQRLSTTTTWQLATWQLGKGQHNSKTLAACDDKIVRGSSSNSRKEEEGGWRMLRLRRTGTVPGNGSTFCTHN